MPNPKTDPLKQQKEKRPRLNSETLASIPSARENISVEIETEQITSNITESVSTSSVGQQAIGKTDADVSQSVSNIPPVNSLLLLKDNTTLKPRKNRVKKPKLNNDPSIPSIRRFFHPKFTNLKINMRQQSSESLAPTYLLLSIVVKFFKSFNYLKFVLSLSYRLQLHLCIFLNLYDSYVFIL